jgi:hypothetical protein
MLCQVTLSCYDQGIDNVLLRYINEKIPHNKKPTKEVGFNIFSE